MKNYLLFLLLIVTMASCYKGEEADIIIHNAKIYTLNEEHETFEAIAIKDGKIIEMGPNRQILNKYTADQIIDAQMRPVYPGFIDAHGHLTSQAHLDLQVDLNNTNSKSEIIQKLKSKDPVNGWIQGRGWDQSLWGSDTLVDNTFLNEAFPNTPVFIKRLDGHAALVNQKAIDLTQIDTVTHVEGGIIERKDQKITGLLLDNAIDLVTTQIPEPTTKTMISALINAQKNCYQLGITGIHEAGVKSKNRDLLITATQEEQWKIPMYVMLFPTDKNLDFAKDSGHYKNENINIRSFKIVADGALGSRGACLLEPYQDQHNYQGIMTTPLQKIKETCEVAKVLNYQVNTHCIGDSANRYVLHTYADILDQDNDSRWRIEHAQVVHPNDIPLFKNNNIIPSIQPTHATTDMRWASDRLGQQRLHKEGYRAQTFIENGNTIVLGTDFPVESYNPFRTFHSAVTRQNDEGWPAGGFIPEEKISRINALHGMTKNAALASFQEHETGTLEEGKAATLIMLNQDLLEVKQEAILKSNVIYTLIKGEIVFKGL